MCTAKQTPVAQKIEEKNFARFAFLAVHIRFVRLPGPKQWFAHFSQLSRIVLAWPDGLAWPD
jgi:hypothetical protein